MKKVLVFFCLLFCIATLFACNNGVKELTIIAEDVKDVPAGEYTLPYAITDYETYREDYNLQLSVNVYDENNQALTVANNRTVTLKAEKTYTVIIRLTGNVKGKEISKYKQFSIATVKSEHTVKFILKDGTVTMTQTTCSVDDEGTILLEEVPEIQRFYAAQNDLEGHSRVIVSSKWVYYDDKGNACDLTQEYLTNITKDLNIYSLYEYRDTLIEYTVSFDTDGGEPYEAKTGTVENVLYRPTTPPVKNGYVFLGWCTDEARTTYFNWRKQQNFSSDMKLYAAWALDNAATATPDSYFDYTEETDNYGNPYFILSPKDVYRLPDDLVLPSAHNGLPVKELSENAFSHSEIKSVSIPATYTLKIAKAFSFCDGLTTVVFDKTNPRENLDINTFFNCTALTSVVLPDHIVTMDEACFAGCLCLSDAVLPSTVQVINERAFSGCKSLLSVALPDSVRYVYANAYSGCDALAEITITRTSSLQEISASAFDGTAIESLLLPSRLNDQITLNNTAITISYYGAETQTEQ